MTPDKKNTVLQYALYIIVFLLFILSIYLIYQIYTNKSALLGRSALTVKTIDGSAKVLIDGKEIGESPFEKKELNIGSHTLRIQNATNFYETTINFPNAMVVEVTRDIGISRIFSSGQDFWYDAKDKSSRINIVSEPTGASVIIDDVEVGKTPYSSSILKKGQYDLRVEKEGFESQSARIKIEDTQKLNGSVKLFLKPVPEKTDLISGTKNVYNFSTNNESLYLDTASWAKGIHHWTKTRGVGSTKMSYYVDFGGSVYDESGKLVDGVNSISIKAGDSIGYLGRSKDGGLTAEATAALQRFTTGSASSTDKPSTDPINTSTTAKIASTPTGWLRVRATPSLNGAEVTKINVGEVVTILEIQGSWSKIKYKDTTEGWVSSAYLTQ